LPPDLLVDLLVDLPPDLLVEIAPKKYCTELEMPRWNNFSWKENYNNLSTASHAWNVVQIRLELFLTHASESPTPAPRFGQKNHTPPKMLVSI